MTALAAALKEGGANFFVYLPDVILFKTYALLAADREVQTFLCSREDEGIAMAAGAYLAGKLPVAMMEGSGLGYSGLILARAQLQRTPMLLLASHNRALGEAYDYHAAGCMASEAMLKGMNIPKTGQPGSVGLVVTKTLVVLGDPSLTTTPEHPRGAMLRAYDKQTGKEVGAVWMPAPQSGSPMTYSANGKQYIIVSISGGNYSGEYLAFSLPDSEIRPSTAGAQR